MKELKHIKAAMMAILQLPTSTRQERLEAAKVILACGGIYCADALPKSLVTGKELTKLRIAKSAVYEKMTRHKEMRKYHNRRHYLKGRIKQAEEWIAQYRANPAEFDKPSQGAGKKLTLADKEAQIARWRDELSNLSRRVVEALDPTNAEGRNEQEQESQRVRKTLEELLADGDDDEQ